MDWSEGSSYGPNNLSCWISLYASLCVSCIVTFFFSLSFKQVTKFEEDGILMADVFATIQAYKGYSFSKDHQYNTFSCESFQ